MKMETTNKLGKGVMGHKCVFIVLPHCVKGFLDDIEYDEGKESANCNLKSECEGLMCFEVLI